MGTEYSWWSASPVREVMQAFLRNPSLASSSADFILSFSSQSFPLPYGSSITSHGSLRPRPYPHPILQTLTPLLIPHLLLLPLWPPTRTTPRTSFSRPTFKPSSILSSNHIFHPAPPYDRVAKAAIESCDWPGFLMVRRNDSRLSSSIRHTSPARKAAKRKTQTQNIPATFHASLPPSLPSSEPSLRLLCIGFADTERQNPRSFLQSVPHPLAGSSIPHCFCQER